MHSVILAARKGQSRKTTTDSSKLVAGRFVRLYTIRYGRTSLHTWAKGGPEGPLGPVAAFGVSIDDAEGLSTFEHETRNEDEARALYAEALADPIAVEARP